jgi:hypothetical protein
MCSSFQFIEQQSFEMSEKIREDTIYKFVRVEFSESSSQGFQNEHGPRNGCAQVSSTRPEFITKVILEDLNGKHYFIEPTPDGLRFARGEIPFKEYEKRHKLETMKVVSIFFMAVGFISVVMLVVKWYLL